MFFKKRTLFIVYSVRTLITWRERELLVKESKKLYNIKVLFPYGLRNSKNLFLFLLVKYLLILLSVFLIL